MAEAATDRQHAAVLFWRGMRLRVSDDLSGFGQLRESIVVLYTVREYPFYGWVYLNKAGQWIAKFEDATCSIEHSVESALDAAAQRAIEHLQHTAWSFERLFRRWP